MNLKDYQHVVGSTSAEFAATGLHIGQLFMWQIIKQNQMYSLPVNKWPTLDGLGEEPVKRMTGFLQTLKQEMDEGLEILAVMKLRDQFNSADGTSVFTESTILQFLGQNGVDEKRAAKLAPEVITWIEESDSVFEDGTTELDRQILVMLSDWLGDMNVYNRSEALKYGIPLEGVLACIMGSNFTKLDAEGQPIINPENGKVLKGPNFVPPEAHIYATLFGNNTLFDELEVKKEEVADIQAIAGEVLIDPMTEVFAAFETDVDEEDDGQDDGFGLDEDEDEAEADEFEKE